MPRRPRLHVPDGFYYIMLRSNPGRHIFTQARDYGDFERLLTSALQSCRVCAFAFAWQTDTAHLAVQIADIPVGPFVQRFTSQYARSIHKQRGGSGHLFHQRYHSVLIDPDPFLPSLIRYLHLLPLGEGVGEAVDPNRLSSHGVYLGITRVDWITRVPALSEKAYDELMKTPPDPSDAERFRDGSKWDIRAVGNKRFFPSVSTRVPKNRGNLDDIIDSCSREMGVERNAVMSRSRQRKLALTRALVAWRAIESGVATLAEVARKLNRDPSTLSVGIKRYKALRPELFKK